jgi:hypothetical protein
LGSYSDIENTLKIDPKIWNGFSNTDKAAFYFHEAIYKYLRDTEQDRTSWRTRKIVGYLFSLAEYSWEDMIRL